MEESMLGYGVRRPMRVSAPVTFWLIVTNVVVFALTVLLAGAPDGLFTAWGLVPLRFLHDFGLRELLTVASSMFLHAGLVHLLGNMLFLGVFGRLAEERLGSARFGLMYALAGAAAALAQVWVGPLSLVPMIGASGAISGALGAAMVLEPRRRMVLVTPLTLFIPVTVTVWAFGLAWLALQVFGGLGLESSVAFWAHIGGFVAGYWFTRLTTAERAPRPRRGGDPQDRWRYGPAQEEGWRSYTVTDSSGHTYVFHERAHRA